MTALDLDTMERAAREARHPQWDTWPDEQYWTGDIRVGWTDEGNFHEVCQLVAEDDDAVNAAHIAAWCPANALAVLDRLHAAEARAEQAETRNAELEAGRAGAIESVGSVIVERVGWSEEEGTPRFTATLYFPDGAPRWMTFETVWSSHRVIVVEQADYAHLDTRRDVARLCEALEPFATVTLLPTGQVVGLERWWFKRAASLLAELRAQPDPVDPEAK